LDVVTTVALYFHRLGQAGGAERMICQVAHELAARGFEVHLLSLDAPDAQSFYPIGSSVNWHRLGPSASLAGKVRRIGAIAEILGQYGVRVLIGFVMHGDKTVYAAAKLARVRLVAAERNGPSMYWLRYGPVERWLAFGLLHLCDAIAVQFPEYASGYPGSLRRRTVAIANPVTRACATAAPAKPGDDGRFELLAVGRLDSVQKRFDCLIRAFARIAQRMPEWDLKIIGDGEQEATLRELVADFGLTGRVMLGAPTDRIDEAYARAHLFVMPSRWEGFPNALAEALSAGLPAVGFREAEGVSQLIAHGETGWLAGPGDETHALATTLAEAMSDGKERQRRGALAIQAMSKYAPEAEYDRWAGLLQRLAGGEAA
jgi:glycosyltransferase involved in cell wall biosynthesis